MKISIFFIFYHIWPTKIQVTEDGSVIYGLVKFLYSSQIYRKVWFNPAGS